MIFKQRITVIFLKQNVIMPKHFFCKMKILLRLVFEVSYHAKDPYKINL